MKALFLSLALLSAGPAIAADASKPHEHQGVLSPYATPPELPKLTEADEALLAKGQPVMKQVRNSVDGGAGGRGIAILDVHATPEQVWSRILKFDQYPNWVDNVKVCKNYEEKDGHIKTHFELGAMGMTIVYYIDHIAKPDEGWLTWTLDYSRNSDLDDSVGFWRTQPVPGKPGWTRLFYSVDIQVKGWVPGFIENLIVKSGLTKATEWVKRESEKVAGH